MVSSERDDSFIHVVGEIYSIYSLVLILQNVNKLTVVYNQHSWVNSRLH